jgi:hypothetical protein
VTHKQYEIIIWKSSNKLEKKETIGWNNGVICLQTISINCPPSHQAERYGMSLICKPTWKSRKKVPSLHEANKSLPWKCDESHQNQSGGLEIWLKNELEKKLCVLVKELLRLIPCESIILSRHPDLKPSTYMDFFERAHAIPKTNDSHLILSNSVCLGLGLGRQLTPYF